MKMTMHVDDTLLARVMSATGIDNKTRAVDLALRELDRRHELKRLAEAGLGLSAAELREAYDPATPVEGVPSTPASSVKYVRKPRSR